MALAYARASDTPVFARASSEGEESRNTRFDSPGVLHHYLTTCHVSVFSNGLYVTLKTMLVTVVVALDEPVPLVPPLLPDEVVDEPLLEERARLPMTLKVTVKASLFELLNLRVRAPETSAAESMLSRPTLLL